MTRLLLAATALGTLTGLALTFGAGGAVGVAVCAGAVIAWCLVRAIQTDRRRERDKAIHPASWCVYVENGHPVASSVTYRPARAYMVIKGGKRRRRWPR